MYSCLSFDESTVDDGDQIHIQTVYFVLPFYCSISVWQTLLIIAQLVFCYHCCTHKNTFRSSGSLYYHTQGGFHLVSHMNLSSDRHRV